MKQISRQNISCDSVSRIDESRVVAISFAEVGAQGTPNYVALISDGGANILVDEGHFSFERHGTRYPEDVTIEALEEKFPFLAHFRGVSADTTLRGNFMIPGGEWIHFDAAFGNHLFVRTGFKDLFLDGISIYPDMDCCDVMLVQLRNQVDWCRENTRTEAMIGAVVGDIAGSRFEHHNHKSKEFELLVSPESESRLPFERYCYFTDDTVMTLAIAEALVKWRRNGSDSCNELSRLAIASMQDFGKKYPHAGYGGRFRRWLRDANPQPYNSWGNGAAMRVAACGCAARSVVEAEAMSTAVTAVTHNHPEGIKGAEAVAVAVYFARKGLSKDELRKVIVRDYYPLDFKLDDIRAGYHFDVSCQGSVPQALEAFFEADSFEDAVRNAISIGGDSDTLASICGAVAGAYYGVPDDIRAKAIKFLPRHLLDVLRDAETGFVG